MKQNESKLQQSCVTLFRLRYPEKIIFAIPNGGARTAITGARLKAEGVMAGVPDLFIPEPSGLFAGCFIEMKHGKGKLTDNQAVMIEKLKEKGYFCNVVNSTEKFIETCKLYFEFEKRW